MRVRVILHYLGLLIMGLGISMLFPMGWSYSQGEPVAQAFAISAGITAVAGLLLWRLMPGSEGRLGRREALLFVTLGWVLASAFGAIPYQLAGTFTGYLDAYFEAMSGYTTTGATVMDSIESQPMGILLWRNFTQWLGGMGIITLFVAFFPLFGMGAAHLVEAEVPGPQAEKFTARIRDTVKSLWYLYVSFSAIEFLLLWQLAKIPVFDAMTVTFGTMPTGGFAARSLSIGAYNSAVVEWIVFIFMIIAGVNFGLHYLLLRKRQPGPLFTNPEFKMYVGLLSVASVLVAVNLINAMNMPIEDAFRKGSFQVVSIMTTTGFSTANFATWPSFTQATLLVLMIVGASAGSTGGALKVSRILVLLKYTYRRVVLTFNPQAVIPIKVGNRILPEQVVSGVIGMTILYFGTLIVGFLVMSSLGLSYMNSFSSVVATLGNVGPGLGLVGPMLHYGFIPDGGKVFLILCMLAGRLEILTVFALMAPSFWKWR